MDVRFSYDFEKALAAIVYIASSGIEDLTKYKICKLLFLADKYHLVRYGRPITGDRICAMEYGPVPSQTLNILNDAITESHQDPRADLLTEKLHIDRVYHNPHLSSQLAGFDLEEHLSSSDLSALQYTVHQHGRKSFEELKAVTHEMFAYRKAWAERVNSAPTMRYEDLFVDDGDALEGALEEMLENSALRSTFGAISV